MSGNSTLSMKFDTTSLMAGLDKLNDSAGEAIRPAASAGAEVLQGEAKIRCPVSDGAHYFYGTQARKDGTKYLFHPGNLRDSIYRVYSVDNSTKGQRATYHIAWNHQKAPYGFMVEFGTSRAAAHPFLRPAYDAAHTLSLEVARDVFVQRMQPVIAEVSA